MYSDVWLWAGSFRNTKKNLDIEHWRIPIQLKYLLDDANYWLQHKTFTPDETAIRFKHKLVSIHCFANGNGRHSRLMADLIIEKVFNRPVFSWGATKLIHSGELRSSYISALKTADQGDIQALMKFARS